MAQYVAFPVTFADETFGDTSEYMGPKSTIITQRLDLGISYDAIAGIELAADNQSQQPAEQRLVIHGKFLAALRQALPGIQCPVIDKKSDIESYLRHANPDQAAHIRPTGEPETDLIVLPYTEQASQTVTQQLSGFLSQIITDQEIAREQRADINFSEVDDLSNLGELIRANRRATFAANLTQDCSIQRPIAIHLGSRVAMLVIDQPSRARALADSRAINGPTGFDVQYLRKINATGKNADDVRTAFNLAVAELFQQVSTTMPHLSNGRLNVSGHLLVDTEDPQQAGTQKAPQKTTETMSVKMVRHFLPGRNQRPGN